MRLQASASDTARAISFRLSSGDRHISALLTHTGARWVLEYSTAGVAHTVDLVHGGVPWPTALRRALADCEQILLRR